MQSTYMATPTQSCGIRAPIQIPRASVRCSVPMPLANGATPTMMTFESLVDDRDDHFALQFLAREDTQTPLVRVHSSCITGDILGSLRCDCGSQLKEAINLFTHSGGILIYLNQEGRGIGLVNKIDAYRMQDNGLDTFAANRALGFRDDERDYMVAAQMIDQLLHGRPIRLLTNNPEKVEALERYGICVQESISTELYTTAANRRYIQAKRDSGHRFKCEPTLVTCRTEI